MKENLETFFIKQFKSKYIGDDGAVIGKSVMVQDAFFENIHFKMDWFSLDQIAYKSVAVNISDIYAMNAIPKYALLTVAIPKHFSKKDLELLANGFKRASKDFKFEIVGGDTLANSKLDISVTIIGELRGKPILRSGAKSGDFIAYTGNLGSSKRDLDKLLNGLKIRNKSIFITPKLPKKFIFRASKFISSGLDISDGLFSEIGHILKNSKVGLKYFKNIQKNIGCSGEEYQFLFTFPPKYLREIKALAKNSSTKVTIFGRVTSYKKYINLCKANHF